MAFGLAELVAPHSSHCVMLSHSLQDLTERVLDFLSFKDLLTFWTEYDSNLKRFFNNLASQNILYEYDKSDPESLSS